MAKGRPRKTDSLPRPAWAVRMAEAREAAGKGQEQLGAIVGKSQSAIADYERGRSEPDFATAEKIAAALDISPGWLLFGAGSRNPGQSDAIALAAFDYNKKDKWFAKTLLQAARMLSEEGLDADFSFLVLFARKIAQEVHGIADHAEAGERLSAAIERERAELRAGLDQLRKSRL